MNLDFLREIQVRAGAAVGLVLAVLLSSCAAEPVASEGNERLAKAKAMFAQRCRSAGEKINRTVDNVEGVFLLKLRPEKINYGNQFDFDDPYGFDLLGVGYVESFLSGHYGATHKGSNGVVPVGYLRVEAVDSSDKKMYRYGGRIEEPWQTNKSYLKGYERFVLVKERIENTDLRYGVIHEDISTNEDRSYWIAGSSLKVIDLRSNDVLAERVGYMIDLGQGRKDGGRAPWLLALNNACPSFVGENQQHASAAAPYQAVRFVEKVLKPKQEFK